MPPEIVMTFAVNVFSRRLFWKEALEILDLPKYPRSSPTNTSDDVVYLRPFGGTDIHGQIRQNTYAKPLARLLLQAKI
jgi:hypothetical protein